MILRLKDPFVLLFVVPVRYFIQLYFVIFYVQSTRTLQISVLISIGWKIVKFFLNFKKAKLNVSYSNRKLWKIMKKLWKMGPSKFINQLMTVFLQIFFRFRCFSFLWNNRQYRTIVLVPYRDWTIISFKKKFWNSPYQQRWYQYRYCYHNYCHKSIKKNSNLSLLP